MFIPSSVETTKSEGPRVANLRGKVDEYKGKSKYELTTQLWDNGPKAPLKAMLSIAELRAACDDAEAKGFEVISFAGWRRDGAKPASPATLQA
jgi:hypothetical protein